MLVSQRDLTYITSKPNETSLHSQDTPLRGETSRILYGVDLEKPRNHPSRITEHVEPTHNSETTYLVDFQRLKILDHTDWYW